MKIAIRRNVFETNSSSTHSLTLKRNGATLFGDSFKRLLVTLYLEEERRKFERADIKYYVSRLLEYRQEVQKDFEISDKKLEKMIDKILSLEVPSLYDIRPILFGKVKVDESFKFYSIVDDLLAAIYKHQSNLSYNRRKIIDSYVEATGEDKEDVIKKVEAFEEKGICPVCEKKNCSCIYDYYYPMGFIGIEMVDYFKGKVNDTSNCEDSYFYPIFDPFKQLALLIGSVQNGTELDEYLTQLKIMIKALVKDTKAYINIQDIVPLVFNKGQLISFIKEKYGEVIDFALGKDPNETMRINVFDAYSFDKENWWECNLEKLIDYSNKIINKANLAMQEIDDYISEYAEFYRLDKKEVIETVRRKYSLYNSFCAHIDDVDDDEMENYGYCEQCYLVSIIEDIKDYVKCSNVKLKDTLSEEAFRHLVNRGTARAIFNKTYIIGNDDMDI